MKMVYGYEKTVNGQWLAVNWKAYLFNFLFMSILHLQPSTLKLPY